MDFKALPFFRGINNRLPPDRLRKIGDREEGAFVRDAKNVDLTDAGSFQRRPGVTRIGADTNCRGLFSVGGYGYYAAGAQLKMLDATGDAFDVVTLPSPHAPLSFTPTPFGVVVSDSYSLRLLSGASVLPMTPPALNPEPSVSVGAGGLAAGTYALMFAAEDPVTKQRSVMTYPVEITVPAGSAVVVTQAAHARNTAVFMTAVGGEIFYREHTIPAGSTTATVSLATSAGEPLAYQHMSELPPGDIMAHFFGRLISVRDNYLAYSAPYCLGMYRPSRDYIIMPDTITMVAPLESGLIITTAKGTWFLPGTDIAAAEMRQVAPFGAVPGTLTTVPNSTDLMWFSDRGPVREQDGKINLMQDENIAFAPAQAGASIVREENGLRQFITVLTGNSPTAAAVVGSYIEAEVITGVPP